MSTLRRDIGRATLWPAPENFKGGGGRFHLGVWSSSPAYASIRPWIRRSKAGGAGLQRHAATSLGTQSGVATTCWVALPNLMWSDGTQKREGSPAAEVPFAPHASTPAELKEVLEVEQTGAPFLLYRDEDGRQRLVLLNDRGDRVVVGRRCSNDIALEWDALVSRVHCVFERVGGSWTVDDEGLSRNGTFLDGRRLTARARLRDHSAVRCGRTVIVFRSPERGSTAMTAADDEAPAIGPLSPAQHRVLEALCRPCRPSLGFIAPATNRDIAGELFLSVDAVKTQLRALFRKFELDALPQNQKRMRLAESAFRWGIVTERQDRRE